MRTSRHRQRKIPQPNGNEQIKKPTHAQLIAHATAPKEREEEKRQREENNKLHAEGED